jgi:hypothetical protein
VQRTGDGRTGRVFSGRTIERLGGAVCGLHCARGDEELSLKTKVDGLSLVWPQNHWDSFLRFGLKTGGDCFLVEPQNQGGGGFSGLGLKTGSNGLVIWDSKSSQRFLSLDLKT